MKALLDSHAIGALVVLGEVTQAAGDFSFMLFTSAGLKNLQPNDRHEVFHSDVQGKHPFVVLSTRELEG